MARKTHHTAVGLKRRGAAVQGKPAPDAERDDVLADPLVDPLVDPLTTQFRGGGEVHEAAAAGLGGGGGRLPHLDAIQASFGGHEVGGVSAHVGGQARGANEALGSSAYTQGEHTAFGSSPDLHTAAHEAAHVVQQRAGLSLPGGVGQQGDSHERHADQVADTVVQGKSAEGLLDRYAGSGGQPALQGRGQIAKPAGKVGKPGGRAHPGAKGEKPFTKQELTWINQVLQDRLVKVLFASYTDIPTATLHRVASVAGAKGQYASKNDDIAVTDKVYSSKDKLTDSKGRTFTETNEEAFKGTLIHELFHFAENNAQLRKKGIALPKDLVTALSNPKMVGLPDYAFGWFVHPKSSYVLHFQLADVVGFNPQTSILGDAKLMRVRKSGKWERSPMPQSGNSISAEEDMCESISLALTSKRTQDHLRSKYPYRYALLNRYFGALLRYQQKSKSTAKP
jgi:hypothetical protein